MAKKYEPIDLTKLRTYSVSQREHKFDVQGLAGLPAKDCGFRDWWDSLPPYLAAGALKRLVADIIAARRAERPVIFALGAHVVKVGCSPIICDLIDRGLITGVCLNGATAIHDVEVALFGRTSEDVAASLKDGSFGMVEETPAFFAEALSAVSGGARASSSGSVGLGRALAEHLLRVKPPYLRLSILAAARKAGIPATVHVAIGTDTIHMHSAVAESGLASGSTLDFRLVCSLVADMAPSSKGGPAGVWCNVGSAVLLPEVFLKAVAVARNLGADLDEITTANLDMLRHYRPAENVTGRPVQKGRGLTIIGHHELLLPLLRQALIETV